MKISDGTRSLYEQRNKRLDNDPDCPMLPIQYWENATVAKYYRPLKTQISSRIDNDVLAWLRSQGEGHLTRINQILRGRMLAETGRR